MRLLLVFLCLLLCGCLELHPRLPILGAYQYTRIAPYTGQPITTIPIWIDKHFGEADNLALDDAINQWNYVLNGYIRLVVVDINFDMEQNKIEEQEKNKGWLILKISSTNPMISKDSDRVLGFVDELGGHYIFIVRDRLANKDVLGVALHEIAHGLFAEHQGDRLMSPAYNLAGYQCIDEGTVEQISKHWKIPVDKMNYCYDQAK